MVSEPTALAADTQLEDRTTGGQSYLETPSHPLCAMMAHTDRTLTLVPGTTEKRSRSLCTLDHFVHIQHPYLLTPF